MVVVVAISSDEGEVTTDDELELDFGLFVIGDDVTDTPTDAAVETIESDGDCTLVGDEADDEDDWSISFVVEVGALDLDFFDGVEDVL